MNNLFKALNDPIRREILHRLKKRDMNAGEIADLFDISKPSISHHLEILRNTGLVDTEKKGQFIYYSLNTSVLDEVFKWIISIKK